MHGRILLACLTAYYLITSQAEEEEANKQGRDGRNVDDNDADSRRRCARRGLAFLRLGKGVEMGDYTCIRLPLLQLLLLTIRKRKRARSVSRLPEPKRITIEDRESPQESTTHPPFFPRVAGPSFVHTYTYVCTF